MSIGGDMIKEDVLALVDASPGITPTEVIRRLEREKKRHRKPVQDAIAELWDCNVLRVSNVRGLYRAGVGGMGRGQRHAVLAAKDYRDLPLTAQNYMLRAFTSGEMNYVDAWALEVLSATGSDELHEALKALGERVREEVRKEARRWGFDENAAKADGERISNEYHSMFVERRPERK